MDVRRLRAGDEVLFHRTIAMMAEVFEEPCDAFNHAFAARMLERVDFWALAAFEAGSIVGGVTAYALPMARTAATELFIYDVAVRTDRQRRGVGRALLNELHRLAAAAQ